MKLDLHVHSKYSMDSRMEIKDLIKTAKQRGLDGVAVVDHGTIQGGLETRKLAGKDFAVIVGAEIRTDKGEVIGYFLEEEIYVREFYEVIEAIKAQNGIVCVPHPFDGIRKYRLNPTKEMARYFDAVEVFNSRCMLGEANAKALRFAREHDLGMTAGSDAHTLAEIGGAGVIINSIDSLRNNAMKNSKIFGERASVLNLLSTKVNKALKR